MVRKLVCLLLVLVGSVATLIGAGDEHSANGEEDAALWVLLGLATLLQGLFTVTACMVPLKTLGVFALSVERVLFSDVKMFLTFLMLQARCRGPSPGARLLQ